MRKRLVIGADVDRSMHDRAVADRRFDVTQAEMRNEEELRSAAGPAHVLVTRAYNRVTRAVIDSAPNLELIAQATAGIDNIDADAARERGIVILNMPGVNANAVAELVIGSMIAMTRTIPFYSRELVRGAWPRDDCATRHEMRFYRLGIVGLGQVGTIVARLAGTFGMEVDAYDPYIGIDDFAARGARYARSLDDVLKTSDIVTLHVPLTRETRSMIGAKEIASLRPGSYLINASRGEVLDQRAALAALASDHLAGLALDVFDPEPPVEGFPDDPRLILTPHIAGCTHEVKSNVGERLYEKIVAFYWA